MYETWYRHGTPPWVGGPREDLVGLVESGRLPPGRALDLGCGVGDNALFLASRGFEVTGIDFAPSAVARARAKAHQAGVKVRFEVDDLTALRGEYGTFDLLVDYGTLDDLRPRAREAYLRNVLPLAAPGSRFLLWCFEWRLSALERAVERVVPLGAVALAPGEVDRMFGAGYHVERIAATARPRGFPKGTATYLMTRRAG